MKKYFQLPQSLIKNEINILRRFTKRQIREKEIRLIRNKCGLTINEISIFHTHFHIKYAKIMKSKTGKISKFPKWLLDFLLLFIPITNNLWK